MMRLFLLFTVVPAIELALLVTLGTAIGGLETFLLVLITGALGAAFARTEGISVLRQLQSSVSRGIPPTDTLVEGVLVLVGGVLLVTPGVLTDALGLSLIMPWTRRRIAPQVLAAIKSRVEFVPMHSPEEPIDLRAPRPPSDLPFDHPVP